MSEAKPKYLNTVKRSFVDVPVTDEGVDTRAFLEACEGVVGIFKVLNSKAFSLVETDLNGNIAKVQKRYTDHPAESGTLEKLCDNEWKEGKGKRTATEGLMWLLRGLSFMHGALHHCQQNKDAELAAGFNDSYTKTLKPHHNFVVKGLFAAAMKACPYRDPFYESMGLTSGPPEEQAAAHQQLDSWLHAQNDIVKRMQAYYEKNGYDKGPF